MIRIAGVDLPNDKRIDIALRRIYGIGPSNAKKILKMVKIEERTKVKDLKEEETVLIQKTIEATYKVEGDLRQEVSENIKRLKAISSYRGIRHSKNLPVRGQRTRSNARTKRGKRVTIGALKKGIRQQQEKTAVPKSEPTKEETKEKNKGK